MRYALATWEVRDLLLIPSFMFSESAVIKRKPLAATARRAGWVGCNIDLSRIAPEARIQIVKTVFQGGTDILSVNSKHRPEACATVITPPEEVREKFRRVKPLKYISVTQRGWTLDVLNAIRRLGKTEFTTADTYAFTRELEKLHPDNSDSHREQAGMCVTRFASSFRCCAISVCCCIWSAASGVCRNLEGSAPSLPQFWHSRSRALQTKPATGYPVAARREVDPAVARGYIHSIAASV